MIKMSKSWIVLCMVFILPLLTTGQVIAAQGQTIRVSVDSAGNEGDDLSESSSISSDGRYVAFISSATNLVPNDTNRAADVFVHDRQTGLTTRVSVDSAGAQGNHGSAQPSISSDGRYVAFISSATNLVPNDTNGVNDVFVHDRQTGLTTRVSVDSAGAQGNDWSNYPSISPDGRYVAFESAATNLVPNDTNGKWDIFVHDRQTGLTTRVSKNSAGVQGNNGSVQPAISSGGRYVAFTSSATNLVSDDTNGVDDVFVHDRQTGLTTRMSKDSAGVEGNDWSNYPSISSDGRYVAFQSNASNLVPNDTNDTWDIFVHDRETAQTKRVSVNSAGVQGNDWSNYPSISSDGRYVAFESAASNLVPNDTNERWDIFVHDRETAQTKRVSVNSAGVQGNLQSVFPSISSDGRYVAFTSSASNLVPNDSNDVGDVFVHDYLGIEPVPDIKANGSDGPITITTADNLSVTIELAAGDFSGDNADWWVLAYASPFGWYYYNANTGSWSPGLLVTYQGALFNLPSYGVLNATGLPTGTYTFYFAVDMNVNGSIDMGAIYYDSVEITITP